MEADVIHPAGAVLEVEDRLTALFDAHRPRDPAGGGIGEDLAAELGVHQDAHLLLRDAALDGLKQPAVDQALGGRHRGETVVFGRDFGGAAEAEEGLREAAAVIEWLDEERLVVADGGGIVHRCADGLSGGEEGESVLGSGAAGAPEPDVSLAARRAALPLRESVLLMEAAPSASAWCGDFAPLLGAAPAWRPPPGALAGVPHGARAT